jgi:hypothetical protein
MLVRWSAPEWKNGLRSLFRECHRRSRKSTDKWAFLLRVSHRGWARGLTPFRTASDTSRPFEKPTSGRIAVKVINHLGDEVMKVFKVS